MLENKANNWGVKHLSEGIRKRKKKTQRNYKILLPVTQYARLFTQFSHWKELKVMNKILF